MIRKKVNPNVKIVFQEAATDDPKQRKPDITKARNILQWEPKIQLEEGLDRTIPYFRTFVDGQKQ